MVDTDKVLDGKFNKCQHADDTPSSGYAPDGYET